MAGPGQRVDDDLIEVIADPSEMVPGQDRDGLPRTDPAPQPKSREERKKRDEEQLVKALKEERDQRQAEAQRERAARQAAEAQAQELRERAETERRGRIEAQEREDHYTGIASRAHLNALNTKMEQYQQAAASAKAAIASIKSHLAAAAENNDHARVADLQEQLAEAKALQLSHGRDAAQWEDQLRDAQERIKASLQARAREEQEVDARPPPPQKPEPQKPKFNNVDEWIDAVEPAVGQGGAKWLREHRDYITDAAKGQQLKHFSDYYAARNGGPASWKTDAFIEALNAEFFPDQEAEVENEPEPEVKKEPVREVRRTPAAPVSRAAPGKSSADGDRVTLTESEYAFAPNQWKASDWDLFAPEVKARFKEWSPAAARFQYDWAKKKARADGKYDR